MEIIDLIVEEDKNIRGVKVTLKTDQGDIFVASMKKGMGRRLLLALYLRIGIDPRYKTTGLDDVVEAQQELKRRNRGLG